MPAAASAAFFASAISVLTMGFWRKGYPIGHTSCLLLSHLRCNLLLLTLHLGARHGVALLLMIGSAVSTVIQELTDSPRRITYLIGQLLLVSLTSLVSLIASGHLNDF